MKLSELIFNLYSSTYFSLQVNDRGKQQKKCMPSSSSVTYKFYFFICIVMIIKMQKKQTCQSQKKFQINFLRNTKLLFIINNNFFFFYSRSLTRVKSRMSRIHRLTHSYSMHLLTKILFLMPTRKTLSSEMSCVNIIHILFTRRIIQKKYTDPWGKGIFAVLCP